MFVSPHFVAAPCHRFLPVSATLCIARAAHHLPSSNTNTSHSQSLHAWLIVVLELSSHNDTSTFHVVDPALVRSSAQAQDTTKLTQFPNAQSLEHWLCVGPFTSSMERSWHARRVEGFNTLFHRQFGITEQSLLRLKHGVCFGDPVPHAGFWTTTIVQSCSQCLHAFHNSPNPAYAIVADNLNNIAGFLLRQWPSNNSKTLFFPSHAQAFNRIGHVFQNACQVVQCTWHRVQIIRPA